MRGTITLGLGDAPGLRDAELPLGLWRSGGAETSMLGLFVIVAEQGDGEGTVSIVVCKVETLTVLESCCVLRFSDDPSGVSIFALTGLVSVLVNALGFGDAEMSLRLGRSGGAGTSMMIGLVVGTLMLSGLSVVDAE